MLKAYRLLLDVSVSSFLNRTIYYLRRLPLVGRTIPESLYGGSDWKRAAAIIVLIVQLLWAAANKMIYLGLMLFLPTMAMHEDAPAKDPLQLFLAMLLPLSFLTACIWNARVLEPKRDKYVAVKLLRVPATIYMKATLSYRYITFFLSFLAALMVFLPLVGGTALDGALAAAVLTAWRLLAEWLHLKLFERIGKAITRNNAIVWLSILGGGALAYVPPLLDISPAYGLLLLSWPIALPVIAAGTVSAVLLAQYKRYPEAVESATKRDDPLLNIGQFIADSKKAQVATKAEDYKEEELDSVGQATGSHGYGYLNRLFFRRHRRLVRKPLLNRLMLCAGAGALACVVLLLLDSGNGWSVADLAPFLPFFAYNLYVGEKLCRAMFYNCDMPLMRYGFYRQAAWKHFAIRLVRLSGMNVLLAATIGAVLTLAATIAGVLPAAGDLAALWTVLLSLAMLLSVHHLSLYYLLQPYTTEMDAKNPLFFIVNMILSALCGVAIVMRPSLSTLAFITVGLLLFYMLAAFLLVRRFGALTFKIK
ncbi:hypothetical protein GOM71_02055 [Paenibacillus sp. NEAU-GSW1]|nr:hypothetical protein [Paenibacillus sp. NEAU-GSW1]